MKHIHTHSVRLANGAEALVTRVVAGDGRIGYGYSLELDATAARHMAESNTLPIPPEIQALIGALDWKDK